MNSGTALPNDSQARDSAVWISLLVIVALGAALRFYLLGAKSLWLDEVTTQEFARLPWKEFAQTMWWGNGNMVLYYAALHGWIHLGDSEFTLRSLSVLGGLAAIPAVFFFGNRFLSRSAGLAAAALLAVNSYHIQYSQELRSYSCLTFVLVVCAYVFLALIETPDDKWLWALYVLVATVAIYTQVFAVFVLASQWLVFLARPSQIKRVGLLKLASLVVAVGVCSLPMAAMIAKQSKVQVETWRDFNQRPGISDMADMSLRLVGGKAANVADSVTGVLLLLAYIALWAIGIMILVRPRDAVTAKPTKTLAMIVLISWSFFPVAAMFCFSFVEPVFHPRYLLMCVPGMALLAAEGLTSLKERYSERRIVFPAAFAATLLLALLGTWSYYRSYATYGNDWRGVTRYLISKQQPGDAVIFYTFTGHREFEYYMEQEREAGHAVSTPDVLFPLALDSASIDQRTRPYRRVWLVLHQNIVTPSTDRQSTLIASALKKGFFLEHQQDFPGEGAALRESGKISVFLYVGQPTVASDGH